MYRALIGWFLIIKPVSSQVLLFCAETLKLDDFFHASVVSQKN
jgi:hypothetical protein